VFMSPILKVFFFSYTFSVTAALSITYRFT
jgi:hypothetical protein